jgi:hypothetical protein
MRFGRILDGEAPVEEFVRLDVRAGEVAVRVVLLRKEAAGPEHDHRQAALAMDQPAQMLGRQLGDAVDVARLERPVILPHPHRLSGPAPVERRRHHQRGGRGEDEAVVARRGRRLEEVESAGHVDVDERLGRVADDVGLVQRAGVDRRLDALFGEGAVDQRPVRDRSDQVGVGSGRDVEPGDMVARLPQPRCQETAEPARRSGQQDPHAQSTPKPRWSRSRSSAATNIKRALAVAALGRP